MIIKMKKITYPFFKTLHRYLFLKRNYTLVNQSGLFDREWYQTTYPDVAVSEFDPVYHYLIYGWEEGRNPSTRFNTLSYLQHNPDVLQSGMNPLVHYLRFGKKEGRTTNHAFSVVDRKQLITNGIQLNDQKGLEIGALNSPLVTKLESKDQVFYVDRATTQELRDSFNNSLHVKPDDIIDVDYVCLETSLIDAVNGSSFDYVIASHVIEHVPDMIGWLKEIAEVLRDGGILSLAIPDKRFTFDICKELSSAGKLLEAYLQHQRRPTVADVFDHFSLSTTIDLGAAWNETLDVTMLQPIDDLQKAYEIALDSASGNRYYNIHSHIFTPTSFLNIIEIFTRIGLMDYRVRDFHTTLPYTNEFFIQLERLPRNWEKNQSLAIQLADISRAQEKLI